VHSYVQLLSLYHDSLLAKALARLPASRKPAPSPHSRYTRFWASRSPLYARLALTLRVLQYTVLLVEMVAKRRGGDKGRWRAVVGLEAVKAACRLLLLRLTNSRPLLSPPLPEREVDPSALEEEAAAPEGQPAEEGAAEGFSGSSSDDAKWTMPRTGLTLPSLPDSSDISSYLLSKVMKADDIKPPKALLHRVSGKGELAEILYILRPLIYALAMQHWSKDKKSWRPWLLGITIEYGARQLAKKDFQERISGGLRGLTGLEKEELHKRGWNMAWWTMRGAFYENITR
jgi:peroxin-16